MTRDEWEQRQRNGWHTPPVFKKGSFQREVVVDLSKEEPHHDNQKPRAGR